MPLGLCILTFLGLECFLGYLSSNLATNLFLGLLGSGSVYLLATIYANKENAKKDNPTNILYELSAPQIFSIVLSILRTFRLGERRWVISDINRNNYSITAFSEWHDQSWREYKHILFNEPIFRQMKLELAIRQKGYRQTEVKMIWSIVSPLTRNECNALQTCTNSAIHNALINAEVERAKRFKECS